MAGSGEKSKIAGDNREDIRSTGGSLHVLPTGNILDVLSEYLYVYGDESDSIYYYYAFEKPDGHWAIMRFKADMTEGLYSMGASGLIAAWSNKESQSYGIPSVIF